MLHLVKSRALWIVSDPGSWSSLDLAFKLHVGNVPNTHFDSMPDDLVLK